MKIFVDDENTKKMKKKNYKQIVFTSCFCVFSLNRVKMKHLASAQQVFDSLDLLPTCFSFDKNVRFRGVISHYTIFQLNLSAMNETLSYRRK